MESLSHSAAQGEQSPANWIGSKIKAQPVESLAAGLLILFAVAFNLYHLFPEAAVRVPVLNDGVLHQLAAERVAASLAVGQDPSDPWFAPVGLGYPLFHSYQHLSYLLLGFISWMSKLDLLALSGWARYLLLSLFPLSVYWSMRRFGFSYLQAGLSGALAPLLSTNGLYGFDFGSYVWSGYGLDTQLWGMVLVFPALAQGYTTLKTGKGYLGSALLLAGTALSHLVFGYIALISLGLFVLTGRNSDDAGSASPWLRARRLVPLLALVALVTAYFWIPYLADHLYMNRSVWEAASKYDANGADWALRALLHGQLFDFGRFPSLTILAGVGLLACVLHWREERYRIPFVLSIFWLLLYFGRPTWGVLLNLLPFSADLHLHRLIAGVHLGGILLGGIGLAWLWQWAFSFSKEKARRVLVAVVLTAALLVPVYWERGSYLGQNARWMAESQAAYNGEAAELTALVNMLRSAPSGRVYAGLGANWGKDYKIGAVPMYALLQSAGFDMVGYLYHALSFNADLQVLFDEGRQEQYNLFNIRYVVAPAEQKFPDFVKFVDSFGRHYLYQVETSGYFELVGSSTAFVGDKSELYPAASRWLSSDLPRIRQHPAVFLENTSKIYGHVYNLSQADEIIPLASFPNEAIRGRIVAENLGLQAYVAEVEVERESLLMLKATYHPNWHAFVDGVEAKPVMLMPSYMGIMVSPGSHIIRFAYQSQSWRLYLFLSGLLALVLIPLAERRRDRLSGWFERLNVRSKLTPQIERLVELFSRRIWTEIKASLTLHLPYLVSLAGIVLLVGLPLFQMKIMNGHDALEYLPRSVEFYEGLKGGQLFPRWASDLSSGYGQPFFIFNPPLFYYLTSLFHTLGSSFVVSENLAILVLLCIAGLGMYLLAAEFFRPVSAMMAATAYLCAPYFLSVLYIRHALADFTALALIPWVFWSLYRSTDPGRRSGLFIGPIFVALLLLSSNTLSLICLPALSLFLVGIAFFNRSWNALLRGASCLALGLGLSAFFWLPALTERGYVDISRLLEGYLRYTNHFVYPVQLLFSPWGYGLSSPGSQDGMSFAIGPVHLLVVAVSLFILGRIHPINRKTKWLVIFSLLLLLLAAFFSITWSQVVWDRLFLLQYLEFPWRFLSLAAFSTAILFAFVFKSLDQEQSRLAKGVAISLVACLFVLSLPHAHPQSYLDIQEKNFSPRSIAEQNISVSTANEFEPVWAQGALLAPSLEPVSLIEGTGQLSSKRLSPARIELQALIDQKSRIQVNTFYFPGWTLYVDGVERPISYITASGLMVFNLDPGEHQAVLLFQDTPIRRWSFYMSVFAMLFLVAILWLPRIHLFH